MAIEAVPAIADFVSLSPSTSTQVPAGQPQRIRLSFFVPDETPLGQYEGVIQVRLGNRVIPKPLSVLVTVRQDELPPDPGEAGEATLAGVDTDGDGVRDDIERYIALTYPASERTRAALRQAAEIVQTFMLDAPDASTSIAHAEERHHAIDCLLAVQPEEARQLFRPRG